MNTRHARSVKFFGDIVAPERIMQPYNRAVKKPAYDEELLQIVWEAFNGRGKRAAAEVVPDTTADRYKPIYAEYLEIDVEEALKEVEECLQ